VKTQQAPEEYIVQNSFTDFPLMQRLQENIASLNYTTPTPIQDQAITPILEGKDVLGIANTGTGKTGAFLIPLMQKLATNRDQVVLVIAPTRELAFQIEDEFKKLNRGMGLNSVLCIGGTSMYRQEQQLKRNLSFIFGTPGRIKDLTNRGKLPMRLVQTIVLDEVDRMLDMGFIVDVREILSKTASQRQSLFFSATMSGAVSRLIADFSKDLTKVSVKVMDTAANVEQNVVHYVGNSDKIETLHKLLITAGFEKILIFGRTKHGVNKLSLELNNRGFRTDAIHGNKSQQQRQRALQKFKQNAVKILVATDVAARGLDINNVSHVINYDIPENYDDYIHRIGRTGRAGNAGQALTFVPQRTTANY
jgi:superfamily II DNA/RNA helicase